MAKQWKLPGLDNQCNESVLSSWRFSAVVVLHYVIIFVSSYHRAAIATIRNWYYYCLIVLTAQITILLASLLAKGTVFLCNRRTCDCIEDESKKHRTAHPLKWNITTACCTACFTYGGGATDGDVDDAGGGETEEGDDVMIMMMMMVMMMVM